MKLRYKKDKKYESFMRLVFRQSRTGRTVRAAMEKISVESQIGPIMLMNI